MFHIRNSYAVFDPKSGQRKGETDQRSDVYDGSQIECLLDCLVSHRRPNCLRFIANNIDNVFIIENYIQFFCQFSIDIPLQLNFNRIGGSFIDVFQ